MRLSNKTRIILHDLFMSAVVWQLAWLIRFSFEFSYADWELCFKTTPIVVVLQGIVSWHYNLYRGVWRFASIPDLWNILRASILGALCVTLALFIFFRLEGVPRTVFVLYPMLLILGLGSPRLGYRLWKDRNVGLKAVTGRQRVLILGAGRSAELLVREILRDDHYLPIGFLDDKKNLHHSEIHGIRVLGGIDELPKITEIYSPEILMIAIPSATSEQMRRIVNICEETDIPVQTLPILSDLASSTGFLNELREISIDDLLGRDKVELDWNTIITGLSDKVILVSGGGGSIGSELCAQIQKMAPSRLIIFERSEFNLYRIQKRIQGLPQGIQVEYVLGDVCDVKQVDAVIKQYSPHIIFHAAAYKHVPLLEMQIREAVKNNVIGTDILAERALANNVEKFIFISTDKAVNPNNNLGRTKRIAEILCELKNTQSNTKFITVRFGNVLGSEGSVVPLFQEQINNGGPITVTSPDITRYFMTIREACQLIMQASVMGKGGEIYVLDMGEPVKITYLAEQMIRLSGKILNKDIGIEYIGLRPGEKMYEELYYKFEQQEKTEHEKILLARHNTDVYSSIEAKILNLINVYETEDKQVLNDLILEITQSDNKGADASKVIKFNSKK